MEIEIDIKEDDGHPKFYFPHGWCPLFGPLPEPERDSYLQQKCFEIIWDARQLWGLNRWGYGMIIDEDIPRPEPEQVPHYDALSLSTARAIFDPHSSTTQHVLGPHDTLMSKLHEAIDFIRCFHWGYKFDYDVPDYAVIAIFAIAEAWDILDYVYNYNAPEHDPDILVRLYIAISLMGAAHVKWYELETERKREIVFKSTIGQQEWLRSKQAIWDIWQKEADKIWEKNRRLKNSAVARIIINRLKMSRAPRHLIASEQTIRKRIKNPSV